MKRREFLRQAGLSTAMLSLFPASLSSIARDTSSPIEKRALGRTGEKLSIVGFSGFCLNKTDQAEADRLVRKAWESGINHFDISPKYGTSQERLGPALEPFRKQAFLSCKTALRRADEAGPELESSLAQLRTDHFDLCQLHHVTTLEEVETIFGPGGAMEALVRARDAGKARFLGFSAHSVEAAEALMARFDFDTIMFPVNYACWHAGSFGPQVLDSAHKKGMGILALKAMARRPLERGADRGIHWNCWYEPMDTEEEALQGLRFTLSHPVTNAMPPADVQCMELAMQLGPRFTPLSEAEARAIKERAMKERPLFRYPRESRAEGPTYYGHA